jgi:hypothetical protein
MRCISCGLGYGMHYSFCITMQGGTMGPHEQRNIPEQETRGGNRVDWAQAKPGEPLPELPPEAYPEPDSEQLPLLDEDGNPAENTQ